MFGQSTFDQPSFEQPDFGQSGFGQSTFGKPSCPPSSTSASATGGSTGGFAAFASSGTGRFGSAVKKEESPVPESSKTPSVKVEDSSNTQGSVLGGGKNVFGQTFGRAQVKEESRTESIKTVPSASTLSPPPIAPKSSSPC